MKLGYDNDKYIRTQSAHIRERIAQFGGKLYLEFGGKLYDDNHAARVLPMTLKRIRSGATWALPMTGTPSDSLMYSVTSDCMCPAWC